jgi:hypothetical protein
MKKSTFFTLLAIVLLSVNTYAQFTITATDACIVGSELQVKGKITYPASDFAICAYTVELYDMNKKKLADIKINEKTPQGGNYDYKGKIPAGVGGGFPYNIKVITNRQTAAWITVNRVCGAVRFKNRYTANQWLNNEKGTSASAVQPAFLSAQWNIVPVVGTKFVRLESIFKPGTFLNIEKGVVETTAIQDGAWSAHWELEEVVETKAAGAPTYYRLKNRWKMNLKQPVEYLNTEKGKLECTNVSLSFQSANWLVEKTW